MLQRLFQLLFWSALILAFVVASLPHPPMVGVVSDKILHMLAFAVLAALITPAHPRAPLWMLFVGLGLFGLAVEVVQAIPAVGRTASLDDWIADIVAAGAVLLTIGLLRQLGPALRT